MITTSRILLCGKSVQSNLQDLSDKNRIILFQKATFTQQVECCYWLLKTFRDNYIELGITTIQQIYDQTCRFFMGGNSLYLYIGWDNKVWGCIGLDFDQQEPLISNLLVIPQVRGLGIAKQLLQFCETEAGQSDLNYVKLWCHKDLLDYYQSLGYTNAELLIQPKQYRLIVRDADGTLTEFQFKQRDLDIYLDNNRDTVTIEKIEELPSKEYYTLTKTFQKSEEHFMSVPATME